MKRVRGLPGISEMTWSFARLDGRATFEWIAIDRELALRWRRIGGHVIFGPTIASPLKSFGHGLPRPNDAVHLPSARASEEAGLKGAFWVLD